LILLHNNIGVINAIIFIHIVNKGSKKMAKKRIVLEIGMGTDIRGKDYTKAACRALKDALWHNSLGISGILNVDVDSMWVEVSIGIPKPQEVNTDKVLEILPHGTGRVSCEHGGLEIKNPDRDDCTIIANAAAVVYLDIPEETSL
jgi:uncharacterized protein (TIGR02058 family)